MMRGRVLCRCIVTTIVVRWCLADIFTVTFLKRHSDEDGRIFISSVNCGQAEMAVNMVASLAKHNISNYAIVAEGMSAYNFLNSRSVTTVLSHNAVNSKSQTYGSAGFKAMAFLRPTYLLEVVLRGFSVVWVDSDVYFYQNPVLHLTMQPDIVTLADGQANIQLSDTNNYCTCLMQFHPTSFTIKILRLWLILQQTPKHQSQQHLFNTALRRSTRGDKRLVLRLPQHLFPSGGCFNEVKGTAIWYHANWQRGKETKVMSLKMHDAWFVPPGVNCQFD